MKKLLQNILTYWIPLAILVIHKELKPIPTFELLSLIYMWFVQVCSSSALLLLMAFSDKIKSLVIKNPKINLKEQYNKLSKVWPILHSLIIISILAYYQYTGITVITFINFLIVMVFIKPMVKEWIDIVEKLKGVSNEKV